jgi:hypothetical protein
MYAEYLRAWYVRCVISSSRRERGRRVFRVDFAIHDPIRATGRGIQDLHARFHPRPVSTKL